MEPLDLEPGFEPQIRARSNTWPLPRPENYIDKDDNTSNNLINVDPNKLELLQNSAVVSASNVPTSTIPVLGQLVSPATATGQIPKKNSSRRNAWGNMSYADLITQAIQSAPDKRLTLSQIYEWMVQNVPYFKDKGDSNSSAGWKNSIRHNLSLHNRFMRVQNEGTGKSSWWMINPDAKPGKSARRRATSMETSKFEKRRGRVKKKVEALRNGLDATPSPSSSVSEGLDLFPDSPVHPGFQLSPEFRPRASSNASSCGRLSPIPAVESDSQLAWSPGEGSGGEGARNGEYSPGVYVSDRYGPEQLAGNLAEGMKLGEAAFLAECRQQQQQHHMGSPAYPPPPPYEFHNRLAPPSYGLQPSVQCPVHRHQPCACQFLEPLHHRCKREVMSPALSPVLSHTGSYVTSGEPSPESVHQMSSGGASYRNGLISSAQQNVAAAANVMVKTEGRTTPTPSQMMGQFLGALNQSTTIMDDLNLNFEPSLDVDCNVDEVIKHELSMDGNLEFNFTSHQHHLHHHHHQHHLHHMQPPVESHVLAPPPVGGVVVNQQGVPAYTTSVATGHSWVH